MCRRSDGDSRRNGHGPLAVKHECQLRLARIIDVSTRQTLSQRPGVGGRASPCVQAREVHLRIRSSTLARRNEWRRLVAAEAYAAHGWFFRRTATWLLLRVTTCATVAVAVAVDLLVPLRLVLLFLLFLLGRGL
eukprot:463198_1